MTYITYETRQFSNYKKLKLSRYEIEFRKKLISIKDEGIYYRHNQPPKKLPLTLPRPKFMPKRLVRIDDMKVVFGSEVDEGYCTLSYSWNQSGDMIEDKENGTCKRSDQGKHQIIFPARTVRKKPRGRKRMPRKIKFVKFEGLIQCICKDFNIKYIWFDQMCINQDNIKEKQQEIQQMHKIYSNAYCTIALVPELKLYLQHKLLDGRNRGYDIDPSSILESQWMKRIWTLEEALMSRRILAIGRKVHTWWYSMDENEFPLFQKKNFEWDLATILHYAHTRTSTKEHDQIFALANIFPYIMKNITIDYGQEVRALVNQVYATLAKMDLSILCFGQYEDYGIIFDNISNREMKYQAPIQKFNLPSWTGVYGEHLKQVTLKIPFKDYIVKGRTMQVITAGITNNQYIVNDPSLTVNPGDIPLFPQQHIDGPYWTLVILVRLPGSTSNNVIEIDGLLYKTANDISDSHCQDVTKKVRELSHFMPIKKGNLQWMSHDPDIVKTDHVFFSTTEAMQDSPVQHIMLPKLQFKHINVKPMTIYCPVLKKTGNYYKAIGVCGITGPHEFFDGYTEEQTFEIQ